MMRNHIKIVDINERAQLQHPLVCIYRTLIDREYNRKGRK